MLLGPQPVTYLKDSFTTANLDRGKRRFAWHKLVQGLHYGLDFDSGVAEPYRGSMKRFATAEFQVVRFEEDKAQYRRSSRHIRSDQARVVELFTPLRGNCAISQFGETAQCMPGSLFLLDAGAPFEIAHRGRLSALILTPSSTGSTFTQVTAEGFRGGLITASGGLPRVILDLFRSIGRQGSQLDGGSFGRACRSLFELLTLVVGPAGLETGAGSATFLSLKAYLREHAADPETCARSAAAAIGVSPRYVQRLFQQRGTTASAYLLAQRLEMARRDLLSGRSRTITDVAYCCGFTNSAHFSTLFKAAFGQSPRDFRRQVRDWPPTGRPRPA